MICPIILANGFSRSHHSYSKEQTCFLKTCNMIHYSSWYLDRLMIWSSSCFSLWSSKCDCDEVAAFYQCCSYLIPNIWLITVHACMPYLEVDTLLFVVYCMYLLGTYLPIIYLYCPEGTSFNIYHTQRELGLSKASPSLQRVPKTSHMRERTAMPILDETLS